MPVTSHHLFFLLITELSKRDSSDGKTANQTKGTTDFD